MRQVVRASTSIIVFLIVWEVTARAELIQISLFPPPTKVAMAFVEMARSGDLQRDVPTSLLRAIGGLAMGSALGIIIGIVTARIKKVDNYLSPLIQLFRPLPPVAIIPLIIIWFGIGEISKLFSILFAVFFPVWINTHVGSRGVPKTLIWSAQTLRVKGVAVLWKVILPSALPFIVAGIRVGIATAFTMVFVSELAGASAGIGYQISNSHLAYRVDRMIAALIILGALGYLTDLLLTRSVKLMFPWLSLSEQT
jgi:NitT/TauT family transport system permease protein